MEYPIILVPYGLDDISINGERIDKPNYPEFNLNEPIYVPPDEGCLYITAAGGLVLSGILLIIAVLPSIILQEGDMGEFFIPFFIIFIFSLFIVMNHNNDKNEKYKIYLSSLSMYNEKLNVHNKNLNNYNIELENYRQKQKRKQSMSRKSYIDNSLIDYYSSICKPKEFNTNVKKGRYEYIFYETLKSYFGSKILNGVVLINEVFDQSKIPYVPDVVYYNSTSGICIDIEIDEKYSADGEIIHYWHSLHDQDRNGFFLNHGWIVIRFAEEQVMHDMYGCLVVIINLLKKFDPKFVLQENHLTLLSENSEVYKVQRWDKS